MKIDDTIAFIEHNGNKLANQFNAISIKYASQTTDLTIEHWIAESIFNAYPNIQKLVIPASIGDDDSDYMGLRIGMHIRLTEKFGDKRFIPLIFLSPRNKETILFNQVSLRREKTATLLNTPNCKVIPIDEDAIKTALLNFKKPLDEKRFKSEGLPNLIIETHRDRGHQLANEWGCVRLASLAGFELNDIISADLYFKYRLASLQAEVDTDPVKPENLLKQDINVLLIDDNAKKGWEEVIKKVLDKYIVDGSNNVSISSIESVEDFHQQKNDIEKFDIVLLDLRLSKDEENSSRAIKIEDFSGSKILKQIKDVNKGIQTVILTASNKAWNMNYLLDAGANGYYIKESPEIILTNDFSKESFSNFIDSIKSAINRHYLKVFFKSHKAMTSSIKGLMTTTNPDFKKMLEEIEKYLDISFEMVYTASNESDKKRSEDSFGYAYLSLFRVVESINKYFIDTSGLVTFPDYRFDETDLVNKPISNQPFPLGNTTLKKKELREVDSLTWIYVIKLTLLSNPLLKQIFWAVKRRNKFIHANDPKKILTLEFETECDKIKTHEGYKELLDILEKIICHSNFR